MNTFLFSATEFECDIFFFFLLFSQRVQILKTEYKYGQYCTPLSQSDCRYFFRVSDNKVLKVGSTWLFWYFEERIIILPKIGKICHFYVQYTLYTFSKCFLNIP